MSNDLIANMISSRELAPAARDMYPFDALEMWFEANVLDPKDKVRATLADGTSVIGHMEIWNYGDDAKKMKFHPATDADAMTVAGSMEWVLKAANNGIINLEIL